MRLLISVLLWASLASATSFSYYVAGDDAGPWPAIFQSVGFSSATGGPTDLFVVRGGGRSSAKQWLDKIEKGSLVIVEGESELAEALGFRPTSKHVVVRGIVDVHSPKLPIIWEKALDLRQFETPKSAEVFACERWEGAPVMAAVKRGLGAALWLAAPPGAQGYERFPYLLQALHDLGLNPPFQSRRLWAFFDSAYRSRVDLDYFAQRWRKAGVGALHVAAWHSFDPTSEDDAYVSKLIEACHKRGILVYAWLELPHVSEKFWADHPEWREKTAIGQDAQLDWRKLMNLRNPDAFAAAKSGVRSLLERFDWDGVNLAELYFESLEGAANPARFTPMNVDVRREFQAADGFDPLDLFQGPPADQGKMRKFLDYRADLSRRQQNDWLAFIEELRTRKPDMDLVLTHVDDRFDKRIRDLIGADAGKLLPMLDQHDFTFLIEDPATVWHLGPQRYPEIAKQYEPLTKHRDRLAIDINIVERYQDVYPTKQQTGTELFQLVHLAAKSFPRVALYFENSILPPDLPLLASATASVDKVEQAGAKLSIDSQYGVGAPWRGPASVNGSVWPVREASTLWLPAGHQVVEPAAQDSPVHVLDFNGNLKSARATADGIEFSYQSSARAIASLDFQPSRVEVDGEEWKRAPSTVLQLPRGQHLVTLIR